MAEFTSIIVRSITQHRTIDNMADDVSDPKETKRLKDMFTKLIPAFIFTVLLLVCIMAMLCRNIVRYFTGYDPGLAAALEDLNNNEKGLGGNEEETQNNISSYKLSDNLEDTISPQNAKQLVVDSKMTDVIYT